MVTVIAYLPAIIAMCRFADRTTHETLLFSPDYSRLYMWCYRVSLRANKFGSNHPTHSKPC